MPELWKCDACGRTFANRNQTHFCGSRQELDAHFAVRLPAVRAIFDAFADAVRSCGPVEILSEKTRIAFQVRMSFAAVTPRRDRLDGHQKASCGCGRRTVTVEQGSQPRRLAGRLLPPDSEGWTIGPSF